ncbi:MAG: hypothetical protein GY765_12410 [bacterium]|nr:hypothetical protein [bacterium]
MKQTLGSKLKIVRNTSVKRTPENMHRQMAGVCIALFRTTRSALNEAEKSHQCIGNSIMTSAWPLPAVSPDLPLSSFYMRTFTDTQKNAPGNGLMKQERSSTL